MTRRSLLPATLASVLLTGVVLTYTGWLSPRSCQAASPHRTDAHARVGDPFTTSTAWRWRNCQPTHWRSCLLQH